MPRKAIKINNYLSYFISLKQSIMNSDANILAAQVALSVGIYRSSYVASGRYYLRAFSRSLRGFLLPLVVVFHRRDTIFIVMTENSSWNDKE
jgi:hypothetical protein